MHKVAALKAMRNLILGFGLLAASSASWAMGLRSGDIYTSNYFSSTIRHYTPAGAFHRLVHPAEQLW